MFWVAFWDGSDRSEGGEKFELYEDALKREGELNRRILEEQDENGEEMWYFYFVSNSETGDIETMVCLAED